MKNWLPPHWKVWLSVRRRLTCSDFDGDVTIEFGDESNAFFKNAFFVTDKERKEVAVFTEHFGYFVFKTYEEFKIQGSERPL